MENWIRSGVAPIQTSLYSVLASHTVACPAMTQRRTLLHLLTIFFIWFLFCLVYKFDYSFDYYSHTFFSIICFQDMCFLFSWRQHVSDSSKKYSAIWCLFFVELNACIYIERGIDWEELAIAILFIILLPFCSLCYLFLSLSSIENSVHLIDFFWWCLNLILLISFCVASMVFLWLLWRFYI